MVAVFGAMSLTPSPALADNHIENLMVTNVGSGRIMLQWDAIKDGDGADDYQARWYEKAVGGSGIQFTAGTIGGQFAVVVMHDDLEGKVTATVGGTLNLLDGRLYVVEVRSSMGEAAVVEATPDAVPDTMTITISDASVGDMPGEVELTWTPGSNPGKDLTWQYRATTSTVKVADTETDPTYSWDTADEEAGMWTDFPGEVSGVTDGNYRGTVTGLDAKPYRFMVRARNGMATTDASVAFPAGEEAPEHRCRSSCDYAGCGSAKTGGA